MPYLAKRYHDLFFFFHFYLLWKFIKIQNRKKHSKRNQLSRETLYNIDPSHSKNYIISKKKKKNEIYIYTHTLWG